jgi:DNA-binding transcriptional LysR family regulator
MTYSHTSLSLDAAVRGMGVALGRGALVEAELRAGSLVKPFQTAASSPTGYCLVWVPERPLRPEAEAFRDWLSKEAVDFCAANPTLIA